MYHRLPPSPARVGEPFRRMSAFRVRPRALDLAAIAAAILTIAATSILAYPAGGGNLTVTIEASGEQWVYPLAEDREVRVAGPLGEELIAIKDGKAFVESSPCPNKICISQGAIEKPGQWIACLPNRIFLHVDGKPAGTLDDVAF